MLVAHTTSHERSQHAFKINISFGLILQNISDGSYRYFVPYRNKMLFMFPQVINRNDVEKLRRLLSDLDLSNYFQKAKPNSKWKLVAVVNCFYQVFKMGFPIGISQPLPDYIIHSKSIRIIQLLELLATSMFWKMRCKTKGCCTNYLTG